MATINPPIFTSSYYAFIDEANANNDNLIKFDLNNIPGNVDATVEAVFWNEDLPQQDVRILSYEPVESSGLYALSFDGYNYQPQVYTIYDIEVEVENNNTTTVQFHGGERTFDNYITRVCWNLQASNPTWEDASTSTTPNSTTYTKGRYFIGIEHTASYSLTQACMLDTNEEIHINQILCGTACSGKGLGTDLNATVIEPKMLNLSMLTSCILRRLSSAATNLIDTVILPKNFTIEANFFRGIKSTILYPGTQEEWLTIPTINNYKTDWEKKIVYNANISSNLKMRLKKTVNDTTQYSNWSDTTTFRYNAPLSIEWATPSTNQAFDQGYVTLKAYIKQGAGSDDKLAAFKVTLKQNTTIKYTSPEWVQHDGSNTLIYKLPYSFYKQSVSAQSNYTIILNGLSKYGDTITSTSPTFSINAITDSSTVLYYSINTIQTSCEWLAPELGCIWLKVANVYRENPKGSKYYLYRKEFIGNYNDEDWELLAQGIFISQTKGFQYCDKILEANKQYLYFARIYDIGNNTWYNTQYNASSWPITNISFEYDYLTGKNAQLLIKYNPSLTNYKYNYNDSTTTTIGGAYPYVRRVGANKHRTFTIGGLISYNSEYFISLQDKTAASRNDSAKNIYTPSAWINGPDWHGNSNIANLLATSKAVMVTDATLPEDEIMREKYFRDAVLKFLHDGEVKIFRSATEGNILVRLSGISLFSDQKLGRAVYTFSATATEVDEYNIENLAKYGFCG